MNLRKWRALLSAAAVILAAVRSRWQVRKSCGKSIGVRIKMAFFVRRTDQRVCGIDPTGQAAH